MSRSSASMFALHASLGLLFLTTAGCRDLKGQCSKRTDTLCLQVMLADSAQQPEAVSLYLTTDIDSSSAPSKEVALPGIVETLKTRPYIVEIELATPPPDYLFLQAAATATVSADPQHVIANVSMEVAPASAARPTLVTLLPTGQELPDLAMPTDGSPSTDDMRMTQPADLLPVHWQQRYTHGTRLLRAISGTLTGGLTVWAVGDTGLVVRGDGTTFAEVTAPSANQLTGVWAATKSSAYVCDRGGNVWSTIDDGTSWQNVVGLSYPLNAIAARSKDDMLVVGDNIGNGHHFDGSMWNVAMHSLGNNASGAWASPDTYYVVGAQGKGARATNAEGTWTSIPALASNDLRGLSGHSLSNMFTISVGDNGVAQGFSTAGGTWTNLGFVSAATNLRSVYVTGNNSAYVVGTAGAVYAYNGAWSSLTASHLATLTMAGIWSDGSGGIWAIGQGMASSPGGIFRY